MTCHGAGCGNAENLSKFIFDNKNSILGSCNKISLLFPCGDLTDDLISETLTASDSQIQVEKIVCYETKPRDLEELSRHVNSILKGDAFDFAVFFSPSGVRSAKDYFLRAEVSNSYQTKFIALGQKTSSEMEKHGLKVEAVCQQPNVSSLIEAIKSCR